MRSPRLHLHPDGHTVSIGFSDTQDTLLVLAGGPEAWRDAEHLRQWCVAVNQILDTHRRDGAA